MSKTIAISFIALFALVVTASIAAPAADPRVAFASYGPAHIGMTRAVLERALGTKLGGEIPNADSESCEYVAAARGYNGVRFMLVNQQLVRIDVSSPKVLTLSGAHVGASQASVIALYPGRISVKPHFYTAPDGTYLTLLSNDKKHGIRFETDHGKVIRYYVGTTEAIQYVEGCQ